MNISKINLNLLKAFDALMLTRSVSKAADILSITQPSMSNLLNQLREIFSDEILIRRKKEMVATQKALQLAPQIHNLLNELEKIFSEPEKFDPLTSDRTFTIAANDYIEYVLLSKLIERLEKEAPSVSLKIISTNNICNKEIYENEKIDMGIGIAKNTDARLKVENLFTDSSICVVRKNHPIFSNKNKFTLEEYLSAQHIFMRTLAEQELSLTEQALEKIDLKRKLKVQRMQILPGLQTIQHTNLVGMIPYSVAQMAKSNFNLTIIEPPINIPTVTISMLWHNMHENDQGHYWLRTLIKSCSVSHSEKK